MKISHCSFEGEGEQILAILNDAIVNSTALYDYEPRSMENMRQWFADKETQCYPVIGAFDEETGLLAGFATYGSFRSYAANLYTVEHSVYIDSGYRGRGLASTLMTELISQARLQGYHLMVGVIDTENLSSISLHEKFGFSHAGTLSQAGFKFGRWLDLAFYQKILSQPCD